MRSAFYDSPKYRYEQSEVAKSNWRRGLYSSLVKPSETRICKNSLCKKLYLVKPYDPKVFCTRSCSVTFYNTGRSHSSTTKEKISLTMRTYASPYRGVEKVLRKVIKCRNCKNEFKVLPYLEKTRKYCSNACAMRVIGGQTTSPKASKGKPGVRPDIDPVICFYSTWEANTARVFNLVGLKWQYAPTLFNLGTHTYRPDFYLPQYNTFIEVKNFMGEYSLKRDSLFRQLYPDIKLEIISKKEYKEVEENYKSLIEKWE